MSIPPEHEEMDRPEGNGRDDVAAGASTDPSRWSRRRFGKAALVATPVIATMYGRPLRAWGGGGHKGGGPNCTPSGWISGNTSAHHELKDCGGRTPGYWQSKNSKWQNPGWKDTYKDDLDSATGFPGLSFYVGGMPAKMQDAVEGPGDTPFDGTTLLVRQIMRFGTAALLNSRYTPGYQLDEMTITEMVGMAVTSGGYTTPSGDFFTAEQVKAFLENTMDIPTWGP